MRASWSLVLLVSACSSDIVQIGPEDAGSRDAGTRADAGPRDAGPRDAGPRDGGRELVFSCPDPAVEIARHAFTDVDPSIPTRVAINGDRVFASYGRQTETGTAVGYVVLEEGVVLQDDALPIDGALIDGPYLSTIRDFGFLVVTRTEGEDGPTANTEAWIEDEAPVRRSFEWNDRYRMDDGVSQDDGLIITGTSSTGDLLFYNVDLAGGSTGFGRLEQEPFAPISRSRYERRGNARWRFDVQASITVPTQNSVYAVPIFQDGSIGGFAPTRVCGPLLDFDAAAIDRDRAYVLVDCNALDILQRFTFAVGDTNFGREMDVRTAIRSRLAFDGTTAYVLQWARGESAPTLRPFDASLEEDFGRRPLPITAVAPATMDVAAVEAPVSRVAVVATWDGATPGGEVVVFEGCGLR